MDNDLILTELRLLLRFRARTVQCPTRAKNNIHGVLSWQGIGSPHESLFGSKGRAFLRELELRELERWELDDQLERLELFEEQIGELDQEIRQWVRAYPVAEALQEIPGIGPFIARLLVVERGEIERFPSATHLAS